MTKWPDNFGAIDPPYDDYKKAKVIILPVPYDKTRTWFVGGSWKDMDASKGPRAIIIASRNMELYDIETDSEAYINGIHTLPELKIVEDPKETINLIEKESKKHLEKNKFIVMLGGEHSITTGLVKAYKEKFPNMSVLQFDAHSDLREEFNGTTYSHAAVMSRVREICPAVQIGIRSMDKEEAEKIKLLNESEKGLGKSETSQKQGQYNIFYAQDMHQNDDWMNQAIKKLTDDVFITIDLDGLDPSIMPSTGTPEPGGLQWYQTLKFFKKLFKEKNIIGFDVVELAPNSNNVAPDFLAAKLIYKLLSYKFSRGE